MDAMDYLREKRCPHCKHAGQPACPYKVEPKVGGGWKCRGYRSRHWDERMDFGRARA